MCGKRESLTANGNDVISVSLKIIRAPFLWKGQTSEARRGWLPRMWEYRFTRPTSAPSGHLLPKEGGRKRSAFVLLTKAPYPPLTRSPFPMRVKLVKSPSHQSFL